MSLEDKSTNTIADFFTPGGSSRALFGTPGSSGELLRSSSRGLSYYEPSGSSRILDGPAGSSRALLLTPLRDGPMLIGSFFFTSYFVLKICTLNKEADLESNPQEGQIQ